MMVDLEITKEEKLLRIAHLQELQQHPGWLIIQSELTEDIAITEAKLFGETLLAANETVEGLRRERIDRLELKALPQNLINEYAETDAEPPNHDPYD